MSSISTSSLLPSLSVHGHGHRHGGKGGAQASSGLSLGGTAGSSSGSSIGQLPVGVSSALFSNLVQSFQQGLGTQSSTTAGATGAAQATNATSAGSGIASATPAQRQELQAFQHSLAQALKQDGLSSNGTNVVSSLQTLINQLGPNGKPTAATTTLTSTFQNLVSGVNGAAASGSSSSNSALQNFLSNLLQNVQASGAQTLATTGTNVNAHV